MSGFFSVIVLMLSPFGCVSNNCLQVIHHQNLQSRLKQAGKLNRKCFCMWLAQHCSLYRKSVSLNGYFACKPIKNQQIHHKMAQGSFASRIFSKYCKNNQEHREPDSVVPHISEFTTMWDKLSKCSVLSLHIKYVVHPFQLRAEVFGCIQVYRTEH